MFHSSVSRSCNQGLKGHTHDKLHLRFNCWAKQFNTPYHAPYIELAVYVITRYFPRSKPILAWKYMVPLHDSAREGSFWHAVPNVGFQWMQNHCLKLHHRSYLRFNYDAADMRPKEEKKAVTTCQWVDVVVDFDAP